MKLETHYGKADVSTYRTRGTPLRDIRAIPESAFTGSDNVMLAAAIEVRVLGEAFTASYTEGDNSAVVATDTMKNFIHRESLVFDGPTLEAWLFFLGRRFLETYPQMERLVVSADELRFEPVTVPAADGGGFGASSALFRRDHADRAVASVDVERARDGSVVLRDLRAGRSGLELLKVTGSAFAAFARDGYTTLPERVDRLLYTHIDITWRYEDPAVALIPDAARYVPSRQVADLAAVTFDGFVSNSIQHLVHEIGQRMFERYPDLTEVSFEAQNRTFDLAAPAVAGDPSEARVYTEPRPPYGRIGLTMRRDA
jgi:urate oxidase